jgi:D-alanyl-D-alanine carboxypeptidase/D-alanyl-D-alanine-endopeptidase (penicillin-binding protein 4)
MRKLFTFTIVLAFLFRTHAQETDIKTFFPDSVFGGASITLTVADLNTGEVLCSIDPGRALTPASVNKLVSTSAALEILGADYRFLTVIGYKGERNRRGNVLTGDLIIKGGGDPALGSERFSEHYGDIVINIATAIEEAGIKRIKGRIISDETIYDFSPASTRWSWGDLGNYYGAGPYGLSVFDNTLKIHMSTGERGSVPLIFKLDPFIKDLVLKSYLISEGTSDRGYVYSAPYNSYAWISGFVPENREEFVLKASIPDPPMVLANMVLDELQSRGIAVTGGAGTTRTVHDVTEGELQTIFEIASPPLSDIIHILTHESVNLYAEHMLKQLGYESSGKGTVSSGVEAIRGFLDSTGIQHSGIFIEDGSGLASRNGLTSKFMTDLIRYMLLNGNNPDIFRNSLPPAGEAGTMKSYFRDPVFMGNLRAKTGTLSRVRGYAGVFSAASGKEYAFCILVNNYMGPLSNVNRCIEELFMYLLINN